MELGLKGQWDNFDFGLTAYANRYKDFIDLADIGMINGLSAFQYQNIGEVEIKGVEGRAAWRFAPSWRAMASIAYTHGQNKQKNEAAGQHHPAQRHAGPALRPGQLRRQALLKLARANTRLPNIGALSGGQSQSSFQAPATPCWT